MLRRNTLMRIAMSILVILSVGAWSAPTYARKPEDVFKGQIIILKKPLPLNFKSAEHFIAEVRKNKIDQVWPQDKEEKSWKIEYAAFFAQPLDDVQADVKFFDVTDKTKKPRFVTSDTQYASKRGDRVLFNTIVIEKGEELFQPNRKYLMRLESRKKVIASTTFTLRGTGPRYSGRVTFTEEETKKKDGEE